MNFDEDVPQEIQKQFAADMQFAYGIRGSNQTPMHQAIFGPLQGKSYQHYFESRINEMGMNDCGSSIALACVINYVSHTKLWLSENFLTFSIPLVERVGTYLHEARHTESQYQYWSHAACPIPFLDEDGKDIRGDLSGQKLEGHFACDNSEWGAYGVEAVFAKNLAKYCTNCSDKVKMDADIYFAVMAKRVVNEDSKALLQADFQK